MKKLIISILGKRIFTFLIISFIIIAGILSYRNLKIDVFPDPSPVLVQIHCDVDGMAPEEVEKFVSYPIETSLYGLPHIKKITSLSSFGMSSISIYFDDDIDIHFARQLVAAQLPAIQEKLPDFVEAPELGSITTGLGMVYIYALEGDLPTLELRTMQDWVIKFQMQTIPGIAAVLSQGGDIKQFQVVVDAEKLIKYKTGLHQVIENIKKSSMNITAGYIVKNSEEYIIRGVGLMEEMETLKKVPIKVSGATPIYLENIAEIKIGTAIKRGDAMMDTDKTTVSGIVMKLIGVNTAELIEKINRRVDEINAGLPEGVRVVPVYNQGLIINAAFNTVSEALIIGIILVGLILFIFINDLSASLVSTLSIPFAVFVTFIVMRLTDMTADLMTFGGLAIGIGLLVDATIVVVENISRNREEMKKKKDIEVIIASVNQVLRPLIYAMVMIVASFLPLLTLQGVEGKLFKPFGFALLIAIISAIIYAVFFAPVLMNVLGKRKMNV
ncbi:MAG: efflux RND transporter permease subunit, partial [bacterium]|nr:efflux RND transporter permease subunit [bacterium]